MSELADRQNTLCRVGQFLIDPQFQLPARQVPGARYMASRIGLATTCSNLLENHNRP